MDVLILGTVAFDSIKTPFGAAEKILGGSATYAALAARYFCRPGISACVGDDFLPQHAAVLSERRIDLSFLESRPGKTFSWGGEYGFDLNQRRTLFTDLGVLENFSPVFADPSALPRSAFLGSLPPDQQLDVLRQLRPETFIACDTMKLWIDDNRDELLEVLSQVPMVIFNDSEARQLTGAPNLVKAAKELSALLLSSPTFPATVVIKRGEYGVLVYREAQWFYLPGFPVEEVFDPTGAGDAFAGAFMGYLAGRHGPGHKVSWPAIKQAAVYGSVIASFCVEQFGTAGLEDIPRAAIAERYAWLKRMTDFEYQQPDMI
jgi:sugar/nucleoside kinase (ribokinase family)